MIDVDALDASNATPDNKTASSVGLGIQTGAKVIQEEGAIQDRAAPQQSDRRSLERVESIKNLHFPDGETEDASLKKDQNLNAGNNRVTVGNIPKEQNKESKQIINKK